VTLATNGAFARWLVGYALASLYPGAPYERKQMAVELLLACGAQVRRMVKTRSHRVT
jgi:hypothetical protein